MHYRTDANLLAARDLQAGRPWPRALAFFLALLIVGGGYALLHDQLKPKPTKKGKAKAAAPVVPGGH